LLTETARSQSATVYEDPDVSKEISAKVNQLFNDMMKAQPDITFDRSRSEELEKTILQGSGLDPKQYQPITTMWNVCDELKDTTDYKKANENLEKHFDKSTNRDKLSASVSGGIGEWCLSYTYATALHAVNVILAKY
jgi:hypothetical protein